jgi:hypothetical protein
MTAHVTPLIKKLPAPPAWTLIGHAKDRAVKRPNGRVCHDFCLRECRSIESMKTPPRGIFAHKAHNLPLCPRVGTRATKHQNGARDIVIAWKNLPWRCQVN